MVKTSAQLYNHIIHVHTYTIIYNEQPVTQDSNNNKVWHREVGSQKQTAPSVEQSNQVGLCGNIRTREYRSCRVLIFYRASALLVMQSAVIARWILSVCPSVRHVPVFCPDE